MGFISIIHDTVSRRGSTLIVRVRQDLRAAGKSATGDLISNTKGETKTIGNVVLFEGKAPEHYEFVDKGRRAGAKPPPIKPIEAWIKQKDLDLNAFAVAKSIGKKGIKATNIYTDNVNSFIKDLNLTDDLRTEIINEIKQQ
tara:strand:- start:396 stop:818 length:423 start_codon:yes stop_codon:yes gene_type:complete